MSVSYWQVFRPARRPGRGASRIIREIQTSEFAMPHLREIVVNPRCCNFPDRGRIKVAKMDRPAGQRVLRSGVPFAGLLDESHAFEPA